jgi:hypothetical protein
MRRAVNLIGLAFAVVSGAARAQWANCDTESETLEATAQALMCVIGHLSDYRVAGAALPPLFQLAQARLEAKVCTEPCDVSAAYLPREGIYLAANLDPIRDVFDRSALLHELVHHLQQGHAKFAHMAPCERERAKEVEAYALQNAYLAAMRSKERARFYGGEFDCGASGEAGASVAVPPRK